MKESSSTILLYSNLFEQNHKDLLDRAKKLKNLHVCKYKDVLGNKEKAWKLIHTVDDLEELIQRTKWEQIEQITMNVLAFLMGYEPDKYLVSAIMLWYDPKYPNRYRYYAINKHEIENVIDRMEVGK